MDLNRNLKTDWRNASSVGGFSWVRHWLRGVVLLFVAAIAILIFFLGKVPKSYPLATRRFL